MAIMPIQEMTCYEVISLHYMVIIAGKMSLFYNMKKPTIQTILQKTKVFRIVRFDCNAKATA